mmetsp:Transcript_101259/g.290522  ORF Transcript_101259/g.290522 Transcript_101259/m.290522 type:complete len:329 (-) Transcript_101259:602-1588(-)
MEVNAVVRAHAAALGANALLCYTTTPEESTSRTSRNQVYHMLSATGHAVVVEEESGPLERAVDADPTDRRLKSAALKRQSSMGSMASVLDAVGGWGERARVQANTGSKFPSKPTKPADIAGRWEGGDEGGRESVTGGAGGAGFGKLRGDVGGAVGSLGIASSFEPPSPGMEEARSFGFSSGQMVATPTPPPPPPTESSAPFESPPAGLSTAIRLLNSAKPALSLRSLASARSEQRHRCSSAVRWPTPRPLHATSDSTESSNASCLVRYPSAAAVSPCPLEALPSSPSIVATPGFDSPKSVVRMRRASSSALAAFSYCFRLISRLPSCR